ncbi:major facilitator superfamily domain-containing protein [Melanogaster broomeanus]|nr:major facilitator superfamily domain-containing protein [Melanogaster broomeanus]
MSSTLKTASHSPPRGELEAGYSAEGQLNYTVAPTLTEEQETKLWRKIDLHIIPIICLMFLFTFTDRGFAAIDGLLTQLDLTGNKFNMVLVSPTSDATRWLPGTLVSALLITFTGFVKTYHQLLAVRVTLGAVEAALYPGIAYYLTMWYPKFKLQYRFAMFAGIAGLAGSAFSGLLGYAMGGMNGVGGLETWSWIFIFDGIGTILAGIIAVVLMPDHPSTAKFLTEGERSFVIERISRTSLCTPVCTESGAAPQSNEHGAVQQIWAAFTDWQVWVLSAIFFSIAAPGKYLPSVEMHFGYSAPVTQLLTIPLYVLSTVVLLMLGHYSDKTQLRSPFIFAGQFITLVGFIIIISNAPFGVKYFGLLLCLVGSSSGAGVISWLVSLANNLGGSYKRATGMALQLSIGNMSGAIASIIFRSQDAPRYIYGIRLEIIFISVGLLALPITVFAYKSINAARDREELQLRQQGKKSQHTEEGGKRIGDRALSFRYTL